MRTNHSGLANNFKFKLRNSGVGSDYQAGGLNNYKQEVLNSHNAYRKQHGLGALKPSPFVSFTYLEWEKTLSPFVA